jgi:gamma-glutamyltranspeptidase/glutathione hydrolase
MAVSLIYSTYWGFGAGIASEKFGILFQNRGAGFTLTEGHPNEAGGAKRPMHTIIPAMLSQRGRIVMPFGVMGGSFQPMGHAHLTSNLLDFGMDLQQAIDAPRCMAEAGVLKLERGYPPATRAALAAMGHEVVDPDGPLGGRPAGPPGRRPAHRPPPRAGAPDRRVRSPQGRLRARLLTGS